MNYKFTAVYRKDETTGAFKEQSKMIFESKLGGGDVVGPAIGAGATGTGFMPVGPRPSRPPVPNVAPTTTTTSSSSASAANHNPDAVRNELAQALAALRNNSQKLESKLEKIESNAVVFNNSLPIVADIVSSTSAAMSSDVSPIESCGKPLSALEQHQQQGGGDTSIDVKRYYFCCLFGIVCHEICF